MIIYCLHLNRHIYLKIVYDLIQNKIRTNCLNLEIIIETFTKNLINYQKSLTIQIDLFHICIVNLLKRLPRNCGQEN